MTDPQKLALCVNALKHIAPMVCFRVMVGEWPDDGTTPGDCACLTCTARETLTNIGETWDPKVVLAADWEKRNNEPTR